MRMKHIAAIFAALALAAAGCSITNSIPGLGGTAQRTAQPTHPEIPEGVTCYVCHKDDIPAAAFHEQFGRDCAECHGTTTWVAYKYPHEQWELGIHRQMQCARCHTNMTEFDFAWQCWGCHHVEEETAAFHEELGFSDIDNCILCHQGTPTEEDEG